MFTRIGLFAVFAVVAATVQAEERAVNPLLARDITYAEGKIGKAAVLNEKSRLQFDSPVLSTSGGTAEMWIRPAAETPEGKQNFLISKGNNTPAWFFWGFDAKGNNFLSRCRKDAKTFEHYSSISIPGKLPVNEWSHVALVWCHVAPGESLVQLYVNGQVVIEKFNQSLGAPMSGPVGIGCNTASAGAPAFVGMIDELRISNTPLAPKEIKANFEAVKNGKTLPVEPSTLLYLDFEETPAGRAAGDSLSPEELKKRGEKLLDQIVGE